MSLVHIKRKQEECCSQEHFYSDHDRKTFLIFLILCLQIGHFLSCMVAIVWAHCLHMHTCPQGWTTTLRGSARQIEHRLSGSLAIAASLVSLSSRSKPLFSSSISLAFWKNSRAASVATSMYSNSR